MSVLISFSRDPSDGWLASNRLFREFAALCSHDHSDDLEVVSKLHLIEVAHGIRFDSLQEEDKLLADRLRKALIATSTELTCNPSRLSTVRDRTYTAEDVAALFGELVKLFARHDA